MITFKNLIPVLEDGFLLGDVKTRTTLPPEAVALDQVLNARVLEIGAREEIPVIWIDLISDPNSAAEDYLDFGDDL